MKKLDEIMVEVHEGCMNGVYSLDPTLHRVIAYESGDIHENEDLAAYWRCNLLVGLGCVSEIGRPIMEMPIQTKPLKAENETLAEFGKLFEDNPVVERKLLFLEGFLSTWADVYQKISVLCQSPDGGKRIKGREFYEVMKPTFMSWLDTYDELFNDLWKCANVGGEE